MKKPYIYILFFILILSTTLDTNQEEIEELSNSLDLFLLCPCYEKFETVKIDSTNSPGIDSSPI